MFDLPTLSEEVPLRVGGGTVAPAIARLAAVIAGMNGFERADLNTGAGGMRRLVEKAFQRWYAADGGERTPHLPMEFWISSAEDSRLPEEVTDAAPNAAWLQLGNVRAPFKWYLGDGIEALQRARIPEPLIEHAIATLYLALDDLAYAPKPPQYLAWAKAFWWNGGDDVDQASAPRRERLTRRVFDRRFPPILQAPQRRPSSLVASGRGAPLSEAIRAVDQARRRHTARPNFHKLIPGGGVRWFGAYVRWRGDDRLAWLLDDYHHAADQRKLKRIEYAGAWPLETAEDVTAARRILAGYSRLTAATVDLLHEMGGYVSYPNMGGARI